MLKVNDDMNDLFRRAAENYPLKTDSADWNKLQEKLHAAGTETLENVVPRKNNSRYLWLLLLLFAAWPAYKYFTLSDQNLYADKTKEQPGKSHTVPDESAKENKNIQYDLSHPGQNVVAIQHGATITGQNFESSGPNKRSILLKRGTTMTIGKATAESVPVNTNGNESNSPVNTGGTTIKNVETDIISSVSERKITPAKNNEVGDNREKAATTDSSKNNTKTVVKNEKKTGSNKKDHFLYAGFIGGVDVSSVKFQSVKNTGMNFGIIVGYRLNKRIDIESGLMSVKKFYYSDGKYFNTGKIYLPPNGKITRVNGDCRMLELPLNLKYNFKTSGKSNWFSAAGVSSWFMKKENYDYTIVTTGQPYPRYSSYDNSSHYWLSVVNLSAGYNRSVGRSGTLRVEPYLKIPLKGMGVGSLPIMSAGLNIGFTKKLF